MGSPAVQLEPARTAVELTEENVGFEISFRLPCDDPFVKYVSRFSGHATLDDPDMDQPVTLCRIDGHRINLQLAVRDGIDPDELMDSLSAEIAELSDHLLAHDGSGRLKVAVGHHRPGELVNLIYIDRLEVRAEARNLGLGRRMLRHVGRVVDIPDRLVVLKSIPLTEALGEGPAPDRDERKRRLDRFYSELGFVRLAADYMVAEQIH